MPSLKDARASNAAYSPTYIPTAVFIGGTSGVGRAMVEIFAAQTKGRANILILGRNKAAADEILASLPAPPSPSDVNGAVIKHEFIPCDASLMKNIPFAAKEIASRVDKINYLVCSFGVNGFSRNETEEGLDVSMAVRFYGRFKFFHELLPLVKKAKEAGEDAKLMTICAAARGATIDFEDLDAKKFSFMKSSAHVATFNDVMVKVLGERHPDITFIHMYPGIVDTPVIRINWWTTLLAGLFKPVLRTPPDAGQSLLYPLLNSEFNGGSYYLGSNAEKLTLNNRFTDEFTKKVWEHSLQRTQVQE